MYPFLIQNDTNLSHLKLRKETKLLISEFEKIFNKKSLKLPDFKSELTSLKRIMSEDFDSLMKTWEDIELGKQIGKGATSEVFFGSLSFSPVAIKRVKLPTLEIKQLVNEGVSR